MMKIKEKELLKFIDNQQGVVKFHGYNHTGADREDSWLAGRIYTLSNLEDFIKIRKSLGIFSRLKKVLKGGK